MLGERPRFTVVVSYEASSTQICLSFVKGEGTRVAGGMLKSDILRANISQVLPLVKMILIKRFFCTIFSDVQIEIVRLLLHRSLNLGKVMG